MATEREKMLNTVNGRLWGYAGHVKAAQGKLSDGAEELFRGLLDRMLGCKLQNMNREKKNFPGIDLGDDSEGVKLCVQVTSDGTRDKVKHTLKEFFEEKLHERFRRLIVLVVGNAQKYTGEPEVKYGFDFQTKRDIWDTARLVQEIEALDDDRLESVAEFLNKQLQDYGWETPGKAPLSLPLRTAMNENNFVGRERELDEIAERFDRNEKIVVLSGLGGMGKTELAVRFGRDYSNSGRGRAHFVRYVGSFEQTIRENVAPKVEGLTTEGMTEQQIYDEAIAALKKCSPDDLLILDNADQEANLTELRYALSELPMRVLITTRARSKGAMPLRAIEREKLYLIFERHTEDVTVEQMDMLIDTVKGHTMTVDLIARTLGDPMAGVTPEEIRDAMTGSKVSEEDYPEVDTDYERDMQQRQIYAHLTALFQLRGITPAEREALCCATLLPTDGMETKLFMVALSAEAKTAARSLEKRGWIQCENKLVAIHPVVRMVCRRKLEPTDEDCEAFLNGLWEWYNPKQYDKDKYSQLAELFTTASRDLTDPDGDWAIYAGIFWNKLGEAQRALGCTLQAEVKLEEKRPDSKALATAYNNVGSIYGLLGDHAKALEYKLKALAIWEKDLSPEHPDLAISYNNVGTTYGELGDHEKALEYKLKALAIREKVLPPEHSSLATSYNNVGSTYYALGNLERALEYMLKALAIQEKVLPPEHPDLATSYNNVGGTCGALGDRNKELEYQLKALAILERVLPADHPNIVVCSGNIAMTYAQMNDFAKASEYADRALEKAERSMQGHSDLEAYRKVAQTMKLLVMLQEKGIPFENPFKPK